MGHDGCSEDANSYKVRSYEYLGDNRRTLSPTCIESIWLRFEELGRGYESKEHMGPIRVHSCKQNLYDSNVGILSMTWRAILIKKDNILRKK